jgi:glyoxylase-like metal-dependent hydrolase (beta-lactamase superfamily II)
MAFEVLQSGIWQLNSVVISDRGMVAVVDPGYFPRELKELAGLARSRGSVDAVLFTHGHWDHVVGWQTFPEARVLGSPSLAEAVAKNLPAAKKNLDGARDFDGRWYVERDPPLAWPERVFPLEDGDALELAGTKAEVLTLPGHSSDGLALRFGGEGVLLVGDYLSPCEIPFVDDVVRYQATLKRLSGVLDGVREVIPGHGPRLTVPRAREILEQDLVYLGELERHGAAGDVEGALAMRWPRAQDVPGMRDHHLENCVAVGLKRPAQP